jgi:hypothetical protein
MEWDFLRGATDVNRENPSALLKWLLFIEVKLVKSLVAGARNEWSEKVGM